MVNLAGWAMGKLKVTQEMNKLKATAGHLQALQGLHCPLQGQQFTTGCLRLSQEPALALLVSKLLGHPGEWPREFFNFTAFSSQQTMFPEAAKSGFYPLLSGSK